MFQFNSFGNDFAGLIFQYPMVGEDFFSDQLRQHAHIVGAAHLVEFVNPCRSGCRIAQPQTRQTQFRQGPHHHHIGKRRQSRHETIPREHVIGLVDNHQARRVLDNALKRHFVKQIPGWIIGIGDENYCGRILRHCGDYAVGVEGEIRIQWNTDIFHACNRRTHLEHRECGRDRHNDHVRPSHGIYHHCDDFIRAVSEYQITLIGNRHHVAQAFFKGRRVRIRIAIDIGLPRHANNLFA